MIYTILFIAAILIYQNLTRIYLNNEIRMRIQNNILNKTKYKEIAPCNLSRVLFSCVLVLLSVVAANIAVGTNLAIILAVIPFVVQLIICKRKRKVIYLIDKEINVKELNYENYK